MLEQQCHVCRTLFFEIGRRLSALTGVKHALELQYFNYGTDLKKYEDFFKTAKETNTMLQIALQPTSGLSSWVLNTWETILNFSIYWL